MIWFIFREALDVLSKCADGGETIPSPFSKDSFLD